jgi:hypothetical protein
MGENELATEMRGHLFAVLVDWKAGNQVKRGGVCWSGGLLEGNDFQRHFSFSIRLEKHWVDKRSKGVDGGVIFFGFARTQEERGEKKRRRRRRTRKNGPRNNKKRGVKKRKKGEGAVKDVSTYFYYSVSC